MAALTNNLDSSRSQTFTYDGLNRLLTAQTTSTTGPNCWGLAFDYDVYGNLTNQDVVGSTSCYASGFSIGVDANNHVIGFTYDATGNVQNDGHNSYTWNGEGEMKAAAGVTYTYDGDGQRVQKSNGKLYWYGQGGELLDESDASGNVTNEYVYFGGKRIAWRNSSGDIHYYAEDFLGNSRVIMTSAGVVCYDADFYPYGGERTVTDSCSQDFKFTGKERDSESNLDNFGARYFGSSLGRFMSPDPVGGHQEDPQTLNKYSYVRNNPLSLTDPTGLDFNLTCSGPDTATCHGGLQGTTTTTTDANGNQTSTFTATVISNDKNGNLVDQSGNQYSATVDASGVHFTENGSDTSSTGTWVNGSPDTKFTQTTGALAGFSYDFSQPGKGQSFSGTFSTDTNFYGAKSALEKAGFSVSYLDQCCNLYEMVHNWSLVNFRSPGDPNTGQNSVHFLVNPGDKVGLVVPTTGKLHGFETNPNVSPLEHLRNDMPW